jgi:hypothetical protein
LIANAAKLELEVDRLKMLVAELLLDKQMLQDIAKGVVSPDQPRAAADYLNEWYGVSERRVARVLVSWDGVQVEFSSPVL